MKPLLRAEKLKQSLDTTRTTEQIKMADMFGMPMVDCSDKAVIEHLKRKLSAAEKERDEAKVLFERAAETFDRNINRVLDERNEALAYAEKLKAATAAVLKAHRLTIKCPAETMDKIENELEEIRRAAAMADEAISTEAPAALSNLRQEIIERCAKVCDELAESHKRDVGGECDDECEIVDVFVTAAAAIRRLAEEAKEREGKDA